MKKYITLAFIAFFLSGCLGRLSEEGKLAKTHLQDLGYKVISYQDEGTITIKRQDILELPYDQLLSVQHASPDQFFKKEIKTISFIVKGHLLDDTYNKGKTQTTVFVHDNEVIGGWSFPVASEPLDGGPYSLDGKTTEEIHGNYQTWTELRDKALKLTPVRVEKRTEASYKTIKVVEAATDLKRLEAFFEDLSWIENIEVQMMLPPDYRFSINGLDYALWGTPNGEGVELILEGEAKYLKLLDERASELYSLITGEKLVSE
ncbi:hypothetical protein [Sutcliffiella rhizosphaerae]|uniref:Lipoprotein n=1 Tax=Sutcliffiella rhizosphaerae TaxID=2880967 RepID=A0ABM8YUC0_9BACI|nr:hypothetical protein [Sutcliffiella rhizosphaerae]CAG9623559.1 hypothetical protein BACCIP111883_04377 [Sutcliffiella rhizosphaerae]